MASQAWYTTSVALDDIAHLVPPGSVPTDCFMIVGYLDEDGVQQFDWHIGGDISTSALIGRMMRLVVEFSNAE